MTSQRVTTGRTKLQFDAVPIASDEPLKRELPPLRFVLEFTSDRPYTVDLTDSPLPQVARWLGAAQRQITNLPGGPDARATASATTGTIRQFLNFLVASTEDGEVVALHEVRADHIDSYEDWLRERHGDTTTPAGRLLTLVAVLRHLHDEMEVRMHPSMTERVRFAYHGQPGSSTPRDAYHPQVAEAIRRAARRHIGEVVRRYHEGERMLTLGADPRASKEHPKYAGWWNEKNLAWEAAHHGPITTAKLVQNAGIYFHIHHPVNTINRRLYPYTEDLLPFLILFALETGIEIECCKKLEKDCLKNASNGFVTVRYRKRRADKWLEKRVRDGGSTTPGGLIRMVLTITRRSRERCDTERLWVICGRGVISAARTQFDCRGGDNPYSRWAERWGLKVTTGTPLLLHPSRLRKTYKLLHYLKVGGQLEDFSEGLHTLNVAANHYGDIPALRPTHEATIAEGIAAALDAVLRPALVLPREEASLDPAVRSGENDVMLNACLDFFDSPFGSRGEECDSPPWLCLECTNAVITERHLPNLMRFLELILEERNGMPEREWWGKWGRYYARVTLQIFPKYSEESLLNAKAAAESGDPFVWIPLDSLTTGYWS